MECEEQYGRLPHIISMCALTSNSDECGPNSLCKSINNDGKSLDCAKCYNAYYKHHGINEVICRPKPTEVGKMPDSNCLNNKSHRQPSAPSGVGKSKAANMMCSELKCNTSQKLNSKQLVCDTCKQYISHQQLDSASNNGSPTSIDSHATGSFEQQMVPSALHLKTISNGCSHNKPLGVELNSKAMCSGREIQDLLKQGKAIDDCSQTVHYLTNTTETKKQANEDIGQSIPKLRSFNCQTPSVLTECYHQHFQTLKSSESRQPRVATSFTAVLKVLRLAVFVFILEGVATIEGQMTGYNYRSALSGKTCQSNDGCKSAIGEVCWWAWDGCDDGECRCDPRTSFHDSSTGFCRPLKYGGERCEPGDKCWQGMTCSENYCRCTKGDMTSDKMFCLLSNEKLLGQKCTSKDTCFQRAKHGYTSSETHCGENERCQCDEGFKEDGWTCRKWNVNEPGCSKDHHCQGGALCVDNVCRCPSTYVPVARDSKCAKYGALLDQQLRQTCDEINEYRYCAFGLVCHKCPGSNKHTCVKFIEAEALPYRYSTSNSIHRRKFQTIIFTVFLSQLLTIVWNTS